MQYISPFFDCDFVPSWIQSAPSSDIMVSPTIISWGRPPPLPFPLSWKSLEFSFSHARQFCTVTQICLCVPARGVCTSGQRTPADRLPLRPAWNCKPWGNTALHACMPTGIITGHLLKVNISLSVLIAVIRLFPKLRTQMLAVLVVFGQIRWLVNK